MSRGGGTSGRVSAVRIVTRKFANTAFSGVGARDYGGRWNSVGTPMVYTAGSVSLAILEWRVHLAQWPPPSVCIIEIEVGESLIWTPTKLPASWHRMPSTRVTAEFGDEWIRSARSVMMRVPSAIVPGEWNYLINPSHPDFSRLLIGKPRLLKTDPRLGPLSK